MKKFYKIENGMLISGSGKYVPEGYETDWSKLETKEDGSYATYYLSDGSYKIDWDEENPTPKIDQVSMRQCRLALLNANLLPTVQNAIDTSNDEALKIEWEYALDVKRDWTSLISLTESLGMTDAQLDDLFYQASLL